MQRAIEGDRNAARSFYLALMKIELVVPERFQEIELQNVATYPNDIINVLGLKVSEGPIVPAFFEEEDVFQWCGKPLNVRKLSLNALMDILPENWSICIDPGHDVEKLLSPWELSELRGGEDAIAGIVDDLFSSQEFESLEIEDVAESDYPELRGELMNISKDVSEVQRIFLARERGAELEGRVNERLLIGVETSPGSTTERRDEIRRVMTDAARRGLIGGSAFRLLLGDDEGSQALLGLFKGHKSLYQRSSGRRFLPNFSKLFK